MCSIGHLSVMSPPPSFNPAALPPWIRGRVVEGSSEELTLHIELAVDGQGVMQVWTTLSPEDKLAAALPKNVLEELRTVSMTWPSFERDTPPEPDEIKDMLRRQFVPAKEESERTTMSSMSRVASIPCRTLTRS